MIRLNDLSVVDSFNEVVPQAAHHGETYLRMVAQGVQECSPPVSMSLDTVKAARAMGIPDMQVLVVEPTAKRLRHYKTLHYGSAFGAGLKVGWYLIGGDRAGGMQVGVFNVGAATDLDVTEVLSIVQLVHQYAVMPAMQQLADLVVGDQSSGGFFGV